jgi:hypothetical protein
LSFLDRLPACLRRHANMFRKAVDAHDAFLAIEELVPLTPAPWLERI